MQKKKCRIFLILIIFPLICSSCFLKKTNNPKQQERESFNASKIKEYNIFEETTSAFKTQSQISSTNYNELIQVDNSLLIVNNNRIIEDIGKPQLETSTETLVVPIDKRLHIGFGEPRES